MSDYEEEYQYQEEQQQEEEENIETKVELDYFETEELLRKNETAKAISELQGLYQLSVQHNLKNWKVKILNQLLTIYCKQKNEEHINDILNKVIALNQSEKYTQNSIKSIITIIRILDGPLYSKTKALMMKFVSNLEPQVRLKSYLLFLQKSVDDKNKAEAQELFDIVERSINEFETTPSSSLLELYALQVKHSRNTGVDISSKIREMEIKMPILQAQAYMSEGNISILKQAIAENMFAGGNYQNAALFIAQSLQEKARYGNNINLKQILKVNVMVCLLINNPELHKNQKYNMLYNQISAPFKNQRDVQALFGLIEAFEHNQLEIFRQQFELVNFVPANAIYAKVFEKAEFKLKKSKLSNMLRSYKKIKFSYICRRINIDEQIAERMIFELITSQRIHGRIHIENSQQKYLQILPQRNEFLEIQLQNLRQLSKRYI